MELSQKTQEVLKNLGGFSPAADGKTFNGMLVDMEWVIVHGHIDDYSLRRCCIDEEWLREAAAAFTEAADWLKSDSKQFPEPKAEEW